MFRDIFEKIRIVEEKDTDGGDTYILQARSLLFWHDVCGGGDDDSVYTMAYSTKEAAETAATRYRAYGCSAEGIVRAAFLCGLSLILVWLFIAAIPSGVWGAAKATGIVAAIFLVLVLFMDSLVS